MHEDFAPKMAKVITEYSAPVKEGDMVVIIGGPHAAPLIESLVVAVMQRGGHPVTNVQLPGLGELLFKLGNDAQLTWKNPFQALIYEKADVILSIEAPTNTHALADADPQRIALAQQANANLLQTLIGRIGDGSVKWTLMAWPTEAAAQQTQMGIHGYRQFLYEACGLHHPDPVAHWNDVRDMQVRMVEYLADKSHAEVKGPGIDISFDFGGRQWVSAHGELNFPDGEFFTGPIEDSVNGYVEFNMPSIYASREVEGVRFVYKDGVIVEASAQKGEPFLMTQLDMDEGARRMGEFAIGTNFGVDRVTGSILLDEKIGGSIHMAIGNSIPQTLGQNQSKVHWDMVHSMKDGGEIYIDGELFYRSGEFML